MQKREYLTAIFGGIAVIGASVALFQAQPVVAQAQGFGGGVHFRRQVCKYPKASAGGSSLAHR